MCRATPHTTASTVLHHNKSTFLLSNLKTCAMYCGDETGSFIGDIGSCNSRFGYGGADAPSYVLPSRLLVSKRKNQQQQRSDGSSTSWNVLTSCHRPRAPTSDEETFVVTTPLRTVQESESQLPLTDPNLYLSQGDSICDWDAYQHLWENAFLTLRVSDTLKHTGGGREEQQNHQNTTTATGGVTSKLLRPTSLYDSQCTHPILVVDPGMTHGVGEIDDDMHRRKQQTKICELFFETFGATALFVAPSPMLAAFAHGRQTGCIVDVGAGGCRVTNIVDGLVLRHSQRRNGRGTDWLSNVTWKAVVAHDGKVLRPRYQIRNANYNHNKNTTPTTTTTTQMKGLFHRWAMMDLMHEFRTSEYVAVPPWWNDPTVPFVYEEEDNGSNSDENNDDDDDDDEEDNDSNKPKESDTEKNDPMEEDDDNHDESKTLEDPKYYELPDGTLVDLNSRIGKDLCRIPELLFTDATPFVDLTESSSSSSPVIVEHPTLSNLPLHKLIHDSLAAVSDVDTRKDLASAIILTGGGSMAKHLEQRLGLEMARITSSAYKTKVLASTFEIERTAAAWIGGSILSSLGSFQQLWLSKTEYEEYGATLAIQRFP